MSSLGTRRTPRTSTGKRQSYREESDSDEVVQHTSTEDEFQDEDDSGDERGGDDEDDDEEDDDDDEEIDTSRSGARKRRKVNSAAAPSAKKNKKGAAKNSRSAEEPWEAGVTRVVVKLASAPKTGHVPAGQISPHLMQFLKDLAKNNEREWFQQHDAVYRYVWKNFGDFVEAVMNDIMEKVDPTVPWLPVKDIVYRIYRDVRFSNDKTPYKTNLMATFSRGGRKGPFAGYHIMVKPGGNTFFAAGRWQPEKEDLGVIRRHILENTQEARDLKAAVKNPTFTKWYGPAKPGSKSKNGRNLWGRDDELKVAPKIPGVDKSHRDIDWLKLRSFCVLHYFSDEEVLAKNFRDRLVEIGQASEPLVQILNSMTSPDPPPPPESDEDGHTDEGDDDPDDDGEDEEEDD